MLWVLFISFFSLVLGDQQSTLVDECTVVQAPRPLNTHIAGCETQPCLLPQLQDVVINMVFQAPYTVRSMSTTAVAYMHVGPINVPLPYPLGENGITCNFITNTYCPLLQGEVVSYTLKMYIAPYMVVDTAVTIEFVIRDETNSPISCVRAAVRIVEPVNARIADDSAAAEP